MDIIYGCGAGIGNLSGISGVRGERSAAVALGFFDGVHNGHRALLGELKKAADASGLRSIVYTFVNHPSSVIGRKVKLLCSNRLKAEYIAEEGIDCLVFDWFDKEFSKMTPEEFVRTVLVERLGAKIVAAGANYTFGAGGRGGSSDLLKLGEKYGFRTLIVPNLRCVSGGENVTVSSSLLRKLAGRGQMEEYRELTGHYFTIEGIVRKGREVGRSLGFPTANIYPDAFAVIPGRGVYATVSYISSDPGIPYKSITNVGTKPTFEDAAEQVSIETNILDYSGRLYGESIRVEMIEKMRDEIKFSGPEELRAQLSADAEKRRHML